MTADDGAIGRFSDFNIAAGHFVDCVQPSANASALFRVLSESRTEILGHFDANGNIYLINPAGILFGAESQINVNRLVTSGLDMSNDAFDAVRADAAAKMVFTKYNVEVSGNVDVDNGAVINAAESAYLIGRNVTNNGSILCSGGLVVMAAGEAIQLGQPSSNVIVTLADLTADAENVVDNSGTVGNSEAPVDKLVLAAGDVWSTAISNVKKVKIASVEDPDLDDISASAAASSDAVAEIDIEVAGDLIVDSYQIGAEAVGDGKYNATATTTINAGGDVIVTGEEGNGCVYAWAHDGSTNTADVEINAVGDVDVIASHGAAEIWAQAEKAETNNAKVTVLAGGNVEVIADSANGVTSGAVIKAEAEDGSNNTAKTIVCTEGGVQIVDKSQDLTSAGVIANALNGYHTDACVGICAQDDVIVAAGIAPEEFGEEVYGTGGHAIIGAEASSNSERYQAEEPSTTTAEVTVVSHNGGVAVIDVTGTEQPRTAEIISSASGGYTNTAYTGVSAGGDLLNEENPLYAESQGIGVIVRGIGNLSHARIVSETTNGYMNTSDIVVCTPAEVVVEAEGEFSNAEIGACADDGEFNFATTQLYAGDVDVYILGLYGEGGIWAYANGLELVPHVPYLGDSDNYDPVDGAYLQFALTEYDGDYGYHNLVWIEGDDDTATLLIGDYSKRQDCPECPLAPCEEPVTPEPEPKPEPKRPFVPAAPLPEKIKFEISGYPALMSWVAEELGVDKGKIQIWVANSLASAKDIQPYDTLGRLKVAATILQDAGGVYINALAQVVYEFASSTAPPTEEQMASIADAMARNAGANNQYALAGQYLDALAEYVSILSDEMGFSSEEAVQIATERYVGPLTESDNAAVAAYIAARLAAMGG